MKKLLSSQKIIYFTLRRNVVEFPVLFYVLANFFGKIKKIVAEKNILSVIIYYTQSGLS